MLNKIVSQEIAKKLNRYGWEQGQTIFGFQKRPRCTIYDLKTGLGKNSYCSYDAPDIEELNKIAILVGFQSELLNPDEYSISLIEFLKKSKKKLSGFYINR